MSYHRKVCQICTATAPAHSPFCSACSSALALDDSPDVLGRRASVDNTPSPRVSIAAPRVASILAGPQRSLRDAVVQLSSQVEPSVPAKPEEATGYLSQGVYPDTSASVETPANAIEGKVRKVCDNCYATAPMGSHFCVDCGEAFSSLPGSKTASAQLAAVPATAAEAEGVSPPMAGDEPATSPLAAVGPCMNATTDDTATDAGSAVGAPPVEPKRADGTRPVEADGDASPPEAASASTPASASEVDPAPTKSRLHADTIVFGATIALHGHVVSSPDAGDTPATNASAMSCPVAFRSLQETGLGKSKEQVLVLLQPSESHLPPAQFVILPPPGDKNVRIGKTSVHLLQKVVLAKVPAEGPSADATISWNNKLSGGLNDFIGMRPRLQPDNSGPTKGELHVMFVQTDAPKSTQKLTTGLSNVTIRIVDSNRLRDAYTGQDIGYCPALGGKAHALCCCHEKTVFEFAKKVHPTPITFRIERVPESVATTTNQPLIPETAGAENLAQKGDDAPTASALPDLVVPQPSPSEPVVVG